MSGLINKINQIRNQGYDDITTIRTFFNSNFPVTIKALKTIDDENLTPKRRKGFNLVNRGKYLYARLSYNGKTLPTSFNTYTNDEKEAEKYIIKNKERLIEGYLARKDKRMYKILENFYDKEHDLDKNVRIEYKSIITKRFIPFLRREKITEFNHITKHTIIRFQNTLMKGGILGEDNKEYAMLKPQTVNNYIKAIKKIFNNLTREEILQENPFDFLKGMEVHQKDRKARGCYELDKIFGIFNRIWKDEISYLLCSLIYTTGMRNSEITKLELNDFQEIDDCWFINIKKSKTVNGIRLIPIHKALYLQIKSWAEKNNKISQKLFKSRNSLIFINANKELARELKVSDEELQKSNITFYSGRHYWKTLMSSEGLGEDIEEMWMGHKVSSNVAKNYNHRDKQGKSMMLKKARQAIEIIDRCIYRESFGF